MKKENSITDSLQNKMGEFHENLNKERNNKTS